MYNPQNRVDVLFIAFTEIRKILQTWRATKIQKMEHIHVIVIVLTLKQSVSANFLQMFVNSQKIQCFYVEILSETSCLNENLPTIFSKSSFKRK